MDADSLALYTLFYRNTTRAVFHANVVVNLSLALFEDPPLVPLSPWVLVPLELATLLVLVVHLVWMSRVALNPRDVLRERKHVGLIAVLSLTLLDIVLYAAGVVPFRLSRVLRPYFLAYEAKYIRRAFLDIRRALPRILDMVILLFIFVIVYAYFVTLLFLGTDEGDTYFPNLWIGFTSLYVTLTTANYPDVMMPAYNASRWACLPFILYLCLATFIMSSLVLAVIYSEYSRAVKAGERKVFIAQRETLNRAFALLDVNKSYRLTRAVWMDFIAVLRPKYSVAKAKLMWAVLSDSGTSLQRHQFNGLIDLLNMKVTGVVTRRPLQWGDGWTVGRALRQGIRHRFFDYVVNALILADALIIAVAISINSDPRLLANQARSLQFGFTLMFTVEMILRIYAYGLRHYLTNPWTCFDGVLVVVALTFHVFSEVHGDSLLVGVGKNVRYIILLRILRLSLVISKMDRFVVITKTLVQLAPAFGTYTAVMFCLFYSYAIVGMALFGGLISPDNVRLAGTQFAAGTYFPNSFNNITESLVTLFIFLVVNNWQVMTGGYVAATTEAAWLFFISFNVVAVLIILNIVVAFILDAFIIQWELNENEGGSKDLRHRILRVASSSKDPEIKMHHWTARPRLNVRYFLRKLFWNEIAEEEETKDMFQFVELIQSQSLTAF